MIARRCERSCAGDIALLRMPLLAICSVAVAASTISLPVRALPSAPPMVIPAGMIAAPSLINMSIAEATRKANKLHLKLIVAEKGRAGYRPVVESQIPAADTPILPGSTITVHLRQVLAYGSTENRDVLRGVPDEAAPPVSNGRHDADLRPAPSETPYRLELPMPPAATPGRKPAPPLAPAHPTAAAPAPVQPPLASHTPEAPLADTHPEAALPNAPASMPVPITGNNTVTNVHGAAPSPDQMSVPGFDSVDALVKTLRQGKAVFNVPADIDIDETCPCRIDFMIDVSKSFDEMEKLLRRDHPEPGNFEHDDVKMAAVMEASLSADPDDVLIDPKGKQRHAVSSLEPTTWTWMITPKTWGRHTLRLELSVPFTINGTQQLREIRTMSKDIEITVTPFSLIRRFVEANWKWLWTALLIPLVHYLMKLRKSRQAQAALAGGAKLNAANPRGRARDARPDAMRDARRKHAHPPRRRPR